MIRGDQANDAPQLANSAPVAYLRNIGSGQAETLEKVCPAMPAISPAAARHRAHIAGLTRVGVPVHDPRYADARHSLRAALIADHDDKLATRLAALLAPSGDVHD
jgi:hypothetical protein